MRKPILVMVLSTMWGGAAHGQATISADAFADCGSFVQCEGNMHAVLNQMYEDGKGLHEECMLCRYVSNGEPAPTRLCHPQCDFAGTEALSYNALLEAARAGNYHRVYVLAQMAPHFAVINHGRRSIQIKACDRVRFIGNIPLPMYKMATT